MLLRLTYLSLLVFMTFMSCKKNNTVAENPCSNQVPFKADFTMLEKVGDSSYSTDTALAPGYISFKAKGTYDSVKWTIGGPQNTFTNKDVRLYFDQPQGKIDVTFIGYKRPNLTCFPNEKSSDTITKSLVVAAKNRDVPFVGHYVGYNTDNPTDTFSVWIKYHNSNWGYFVKNIPKGCPGYTNPSDGGYPLNVGLEVAVGYKLFQFGRGSMSCNTVYGYGALSKLNDTLSIQYLFYPRTGTGAFDFGPQTKKTFIGVRKN